QMFSHIGIATRMWIEMAHKMPKSLVGFDFLKFVEPIKAEEAKPRTKAQILELLRTDGDKFAAWLETLTPEFLAETIIGPDGKTVKTRFERILAAKEHEMHHRAQLMLIERQLGIVPHITRQFNERIAQMKAAQAEKVHA